jgi:hypothetical protein
MAIKYTNSVDFKALQNLPKLGFLVWKYTIWQPWTWDAKNGEKSFSKKDFEREVKEGDQIGRIFEYWAITFFGQVWKITYVSSPNFWTTFV